MRFAVVRTAGFGGERTESDT